MHMHTCATYMERAYIQYCWTFVPTRPGQLWTKRERRGQRRSAGPVPRQPLARHR